VLTNVRLSGDDKAAFVLVYADAGANRMEPT
jgi:hypothetical protein